MAYFLSLCLFPFFSFSISFTTFFFFSKRWCKSPKLCSRDSSSSQTSSSFSTRKITNPWLYNFWQYLRSSRFRKLLFRWHIRIFIIMSPWKFCRVVSEYHYVRLCRAQSYFFFIFIYFVFIQTRIHRNFLPKKNILSTFFFFSFTRIRWARCASLIAST